MDDWISTTSRYEQCTDTCPCCGFMTVSQEFDICGICGWEDDRVQRRHPDVTGANRVTLRDGQRHFAETGASAPGTAPEIRRDPTAADRRDPGWAPLDAK